jgi:hypothetical protein
VLAAATFGAVRSGNRSARIAETALQEQRRPILVHSRPEDPQQKIGFADGRWVRVDGGRAAVEHDNGNVYLALSLRNVGAGIAVLHGWYVWPALRIGRQEHAPAEQFRLTSRDLLIPPGDIGLWQGALRDPSDENHGAVVAAHTGREPFALDLLYGDAVGGQRSISRFALTPVGEAEWLGAVVRHWSLDGPELHRV